MIFTSLALTALLILLMAVWVLSRARAVIPTVMLANYAVVLPMAGAISFFITQDDRVCSESSGVVVAIIWLMYASALAIVLLQFNKIFSIDRLRNSLLMISESSIAYALMAWWLIKIWLYIAYGSSSIRAMQVLPDSDLHFSYLEASAELVINQFLGAAFVVLVLRAAWRQMSPWSIAFGVITLMAVILFGDMTVGSRRSLVMLIVLYMTARAVEVGYKRVIKELLIIGSVGVGVFLYYPLIRYNITDPSITDDIVSSEPLRMMNGAGKLLTPNMDIIGGDAPETFREGVAQLYCRLNDKQMNGHSLSWGEVTGDAIYLALPAIIAPNKSEKDPDTRLAESYDLYPKGPYVSLDLSANPLLQLQADFGFFVALSIALVLQAFLLILGSAYLVKSASVIKKLIAASLLWFVINSNEASLTQLLVAMRQFIMLSLIVWCLEIMIRTKYITNRELMR